MKMSVKLLMSAFVAGSLAFAATAAAQDQKKHEQPAQHTQPATHEAQPAKTDKTAKPAETTVKHDDTKKDEKKADKTEALAKVGSLAPTFKLKDTDGTEHDIAKYIAEGKIVVLEWFNPDCPFVKKHHELNTTFTDLHKKYESKGVVFLAINSGAAGEQGNGLDRNKKAKADYKIAYPILLDESGDIGRVYGAKTTPHMYVINKDGILAYAGAIDDDKDAKRPGKTNYVAKALDEILAGKKVETSTTDSYGCPVKYGKKAKN